MVEKHLERPVDKPHIFLPPSIELHMLFSVHSVRDDVGNPLNFKRLVKSSDIVIPEAVGWDNSSLDFYRKISKGDYEAYEAGRAQCADEFSLLLLEALYNSHTYVVFVDLPGEEGMSLYKDSVANISGITSLHQSSFAEVLEELDEQLRLNIQAETKREEHILYALGPELEHVIETHPRFQNKPKVSVLMMLGKGHIDMFDKVSSAVTPLSSGLPTVVKVGDPQIIGQTQLALYYKRAEEPLEELRKKLLAETFIGFYLAKLSPSQVAYETVEEAVAQLSFEELEEIYHVLRSCKEERVSFGSALDRLPLRLTQLLTFKV